MNVSMPGALSIMQENVNQLDEWASKREAFLSKGKKTVQAKMLDLLGLKGLPDHKIRIEATGHDSMREYEQYKFQLIREGEMPVPCILIMPSRANADSPVELRLQEEGKGTYLSEYANFAAALTEGKSCCWQICADLGKQRILHSIRMLNIGTVSIAMQWSVCI